MLFNDPSSIRALKAFLTACFFLIALPALIWAGEFTAFGPKSFMRETGAPVSVTDNFLALNPNTDFILRVYNGGLQDTAAELVSSSIISLNGKQVLGPKEFSQSVKFIEKPVSLQLNNKLEIQVRGKPGGLITVKVLGRDNIAPNIQFIEPLPGSLTNINPQNIKLSFNDDISGINADSFKVFINDIDKTNSFSITTTGLSGSASAAMPLSEGANIIRVSIADFAGNTNLVSATVFLDSKPPAQPVELVAKPGNTVADLSWAAGTEPDLSGYNIYRSTTSSSGYTKINPALINTTVYRDIGLVNGTKYYYVVTAVDRSNNESGYSIEVSVTPYISEDMIKDVSDSPDAFSPNGDNNADTSTINYLLTKDGTVTLKIYDAANKLVRTLKDALLEIKGPQTALWDGKDNSNNILADSTYTYKIDAQDSLGNPAVQVSGTITIDNHFMRFVEPAPGSSLVGEITLKVVDSNYIHNEGNLTINYRKKGTDNWFSIDSVPVKQADGSWKGTWNTKAVPNGEYELAVWAVYYDLNNSYRIEQSVPVVYLVDNIGPNINNLKAVLNPFSPDESGTWVDITTGEVFNDPGPNRILDDITTISFTASTLSFFDMKIFDSSDQLIRQLVSQALYPDPQTQKIQVQWDGRQDNGSFVKNGQYKLVIKAGRQEKSIMIGVDKKPSLTNVKIAPNPFSPDGNGVNDATTISYNLSENSYVTVEIYQQDTLVGKLTDNLFQTYGSYSHIWDGKDGQGANLAGGQYTVKISAKAETGNIADPVSLGVFLSYISNVSISCDKINPYLSQTTKITYNAGVDSILSIKIYNSKHSLVRNLILNESRVSGDHSETWDGKDDSGNIVSDGAYYFIIEDSSSGSPAIVYDPRGTGERDISRSITFSATEFKPLLNQFCALTYTLPEPAKVTIKVRSNRYSGPAIKVIKYQELTSSGVHQTLWDGRDEAGNFVKNAGFTFAAWGYVLDKNSILVVGGRPEIGNISISPIRFSPYLSPYSSTSAQNEAVVSFTLSRQANVTINIYDSAGILVRTLLNDILCNAGESSVVWNGKDNQERFLSNGFYRIVTQARNGDNYSEAIMLHSEIYY